MKKLSLVLVFCAAPALAQISVTPGEAPVPAAQQAAPTPQPIPEKTTPVRRAEPIKAATPAPSATPAPRKKGGFFGFFRRIFGGGDAKKAAPARPEATPVRKPGAKPKPSATPKVVAKPKPTATPKPSATPKPTATPKPSATPKPTATPQPSATPKPTATPAPIPLPIASPKPAPKAPAPTPSPVSQAIPETPIPAMRSTRSMDTTEAQYQKIKKQALKDSSVMELHEKMVSILSTHPEGGEAYKAAASEYTTALFAKMRQLDPSNEEQITRKEAATKRRLNAGLPIVQ